MNNSALNNLLAAIRKYEGGTYGQIYGGAKGVGKVSAIDVSIMTLRGVQGLQARMLKGKSVSTACGGYQFIRKTLALTILEMNLTGKEIWTPNLQDQMAIHLLQKRGLNSFLLGKMTRTDFANRLAMEWASLPVVTPINGKKVGQSYYAGDGLNKSHHKPADILALVDALRVTQPAPPAPVPVEPVIIEPQPLPPVTPAPTGLWAWLKSLFA